MDFPFLLLLVSGGHCQLLAAAGVEDYRLYGTTIDDAVGEAFDKTAKLLGLPYPGGPNVEIHAARGNPRAYALPRPLLVGRRPGMDFSFSGLKTAVRQLTAQTQVNVDDACASFQAAAIDILSDRTARALARFRQDFPGCAAPDPGGRGRCCRQCRHRRGAEEVGGRATISTSACRRPILHRQCGHDRLGGAGAVRAGKARSARFQPAGALAAGWIRRQPPKWRAPEERLEQINAPLSDFDNEAAEIGAGFDGFGKNAHE